MKNLIKPPVQKNDTTKIGQNACERCWLDKKNLYSVYAVHTVFKDVEWRLENWQNCDELGYPEIMLKTVHWDNIVTCTKDLI